VIEVMPPLAEKGTGFAANAVTGAMTDKTRASARLMNNNLLISRLPLI